MSPFPPPSLRLKAPEASLRPVSSLRVQTVNVPLMFGRSPNITGTVEMEGASGAALLYADAKVEGALQMKGSSSVVPNGTDGNGKHLAIDASRVSAVYGGASSVQPASVRVLPVIKI